MRLLFIFLTLFAISGTIAADTHKDVKVEQVDDFSALASQSKKQRLPILVMFSSEQCPYCMRLEEDFLKPMLRSGDYDDKVIIRKLKIDGFGEIRDFDGNAIEIEDFTARYKVYVTPTVAFLDSHGAQLVPKRVGLTTPDFYGGYLDQSIESALDLLRRNKPVRVELSSLESNQ